MSKCCVWFNSLRHGGMKSSISIVNRLKSLNHVIQRNILVLMFYAHTIHSYRYVKGPLNISALRCCRLAISDQRGWPSRRGSNPRSVSAQWVTVPSHSRQIPSANKINHSTVLKIRLHEATSYVADHIKDMSESERKTVVSQYYVINVRPENRISKTKDTKHENFVPNQSNEAQILNSCRDCPHHSLCHKYKRQNLYLYWQYKYRNTEINAVLSTHPLITALKNKQNIVLVGLIKLVNAAVGYC
jgi:hypothetical protein